MPKLAGRLAGVLEEGFGLLEALPNLVRSVPSTPRRQHVVASVSGGGRRLGQGELTQQSSAEKELCSLTRAGADRPLVVWPIVLSCGCGCSLFSPSFLSPIPFPLASHVWLNVNATIAVPSTTGSSRSSTPIQSRLAPDWAPDYPPTRDWAFSLSPRPGNAPYG